MESAISIVASRARFRREESALVALTLEVARAISALLADSGRRGERDEPEHTEPDATTQAAMADRLALLAEAMSRVGKRPPVPPRTPDL